MAEVGLIASGMGIASLAIQIGDGILKLKAFWESVKDAPDDIRYILEEIETINLLLSEIISTREALPAVNTATGTKCLGFCQRGAEILGNVVEDLQKGIEKRQRIGSVKAALKMGAIDRLRDKLRRAQYLLMLSNQIYSHALQKQGHELQLRLFELNQQKFRELQDTVSKSSEMVIPLQSSAGMVATANSSGDDEDNRISNDEEHQKFGGSYRGIVKVSNQQRRFTAKLCPSRWYASTSRTWEFCGFQASSGWNFTFRQYFTLEQNSPIALCVENGDIDGARLLFASKQATPNDRFHSGLTLLDMAFWYKDFEICRLLLDQGSDPNASHYRSAISSVVISNQNYTTQGCIGLLRLLAPKIDIQDPERAIYLDTIWYYGNFEVLIWLLQQSNSDWKQEKLQDLVQFTLELCGPNLGIANASIIKMLLSGRQLESSICATKSSCGDTLLHHASGSLAHAIRSFFGTKGHLENLNTIRATDFKAGGRFYDSKISCAFDVIQWLIISGSQLHERGSGGRSPLLTIRYTFRQYSPWLLTELQLFPLVELVSKIWLELLQEMGNDLVEYGQVEKELYMHTRSTYEGFRCKERGHIKLHFCRLISFSYGPSPEDWKFWFTEMEEWEVWKYLPQFWTMIDHPEWAMPGAWPVGSEEESWD